MPRARARARRRSRAQCAGEGAHSNRAEGGRHRAPRARLPTSRRATHSLTRAQLLLPRGASAWHAACSTRRARRQAGLTQPLCPTHAAGINRALGARPPSGGHTHVNLESLLLAAILFPPSPNDFNFAARPMMRAAFRAASQRRWASGPPAAVPAARPPSPLLRLVGDDLLASRPKQIALSGPGGFLGRHVLSAVLQVHAHRRAHGVDTGEVILLSSSPGTLMSKLTRTYGREVRTRLPPRVARARGQAGRARRAPTAAVRTAARALHACHHARRGSWRPHRAPLARRRPARAPASRASRGSRGRQ